MTSDDEIVRVAQGTFAEIELKKALLDEQGIPSHVVGDELDSGIGTALPNSVELWVTQQVLKRAQQILEQAEQE